MKFLEVTAQIGPFSDQVSINPKHVVSFRPSGGSSRNTLVLVVMSTGESWKVVSSYEDFKKKLQEFNVSEPAVSNYFYNQKKES